jgi:hypothetical protein
MCISRLCSVENRLNPSVSREHSGLLVPGDQRDLRASSGHRTDSPKGPSELRNLGKHLRNSPQRQRSYHCSDTQIMIKPSADEQIRAFLKDLLARHSGTSHLWHGREPWRAISGGRRHWMSCRRNGRQRLGCIGESRQQSSVSDKYRAVPRVGMQPPKLPIMWRLW